MLVVYKAYTELLDVMLLSYATPEILLTYGFQIIGVATEDLILFLNIRI
jgi:hypothetical protein